MSDGHVRFLAAGSLSDGSSLGLTRLAAWASSAPSVATIDGTGRALVVGEGVTTVTATLDGLVGSPLLTVTAVVPIPAMSTWGLVLTVAGSRWGCGDGSSPRAVGPLRRMDAGLRLSNASDSYLRRPRERARTGLFDATGRPRGAAA